MEYGPSDSSGTDDNLPPSHQKRSVRGAVGAANGRPLIGGLPYPRMQNDIEIQIHLIEQEAYSAVLRAFKAQSDAITWEKEGLITELRKELRVSDEEHRELLSSVNADEIIRRIRDWRQTGGLQSGLPSNAQPNLYMVPSPTLSASRKRLSSRSAARPLSGSLHSQTFGAPMQPSSSAANRGIRGKKLKSGQLVPATFYGTSRSDQALGINASAVMMTMDHVGASPYEHLIGRKVMTRWPDDNNFYEAIIKDYDAAKGLHLFAYDMNTPNETWEWVNLKEISPEDIKWEGADTGVSHRGGRGFIKSTGRGGGSLGFGRGRGLLKGQSQKNFPPFQNGVGKSKVEEFEIMNTSILIKEVEMLLDKTHPDPLEIEKAKRVVKEHEESLMDAIAKLAYVSDGESDDGGHHASHGQCMNRDTNWNQQLTGNQHKANYADNMATEGRTGSDADPTRRPDDHGNDNVDI